jgi:hypothetical protein
LTIGDFPRDFQGLYSHKIDGLLVVDNEDGIVPLDVTGNKNLSILTKSNKTSDVDIIRKFSVNTILHPDKMKPGSTLLVEEAYFGTRVDIQMPPNISFEVINGYHNHPSSMQRAPNRIKIRKSLTVFAGALFLADNVEFGTDSVLHVVYRFTELPYVELNRNPESAFTHQPRVTFFYDNGDDAEYNFIKSSHEGALADSAFPVICGAHLNCSSWKSEFKADNANWTLVNGKTSILTTKCESVRPDFECLNIVFRQITPPTTKHPPSPSHKNTALVIGVAVGSVVGIVIICLTVFCVARNRDKKEAYPVSLVSEQTLIGKDT